MSIASAIKIIDSGLHSRIFNFRKVILSTVIAFFVLIYTSNIALASDDAQSLDAGWQYRWGDSSFTLDGIPEWTVEGFEQGEWRDIDFPSNPPERNNQTNVWYKITLPVNDWRDPVMYIFSVDLITEVYIDNHQIYHYGTFDKQGQGRFEGWPWHMINLPNDFSGKTIYFRVFSSASDIGLWGEVKLMERISLFRYIVDNSITDVIVSGLSLLIALLTLIFATVQSNRQTYLLIFFFTFASSVMLLAQSQVKQFLFNAPLLWDHIAATAYFILPIAMALLFGSWCQTGRFSKHIKAIWIFHTVFVCVAIGGSIVGYVELSSMYFLFDMLLAFSLIILFFITFSQFNSVQNDIKVLIFSFAVFSLFLLVDMGVAHNILPWTRMPIALGLLFFSITIVAVSLRHFAIVQSELKELNATLEQKVEDRTKELKRLASIDSLTELMNRRAFYLEAERIFQSSKRYGRDMAVLMLDIDYFKQFNDSYGHAIGDAVIIAVVGCIQRVCRETDLPARFGGEEFVVLLEEADKTKALMIAERLRQTISEIEISNVDKNITASIGISLLEKQTESLDALIFQADKAMYLAKDNGRNNCQVANV